MYPASHTHVCSLLPTILPTALTSQHPLSSLSSHFSSGRSPEAVIRERMKISLTIQSLNQSSEFTKSVTLSCWSTI